MSFLRTITLTLLAALLLPACRSIQPSRDDEILEATESGEYQFPTWPGGKQIVRFTPPHPCKASVLLGPDFTVHYFYYRDSNDDGYPLIAIYHGNHPNWNKQAGEFKPLVRNIDGKEVHWYLGGREKMIKAEALIPSNNGAFFHIWTIAHDWDTIAEAVGAFRSFSSVTGPS